MEEMTPRERAEIVNEAMIQNVQYRNLLWEFMDEHNLQHEFYLFLRKHIDQQTDGMNFLDLDHISMDYQGYDK